MYSRFPHISFTPFLKGVANRLFMQQRPSIPLLPEPSAFVKGRSERSALFYGTNEAGDHPLSQPDNQR